MRYFGDIDVDLEGLESFAAHEIVQAPAMGEMSREGFVNGWQERKYVLIGYSRVPMN
jgi:DCN1-like protein 1/2